MFLLCCIVISFILTHYGLKLCGSKDSYLTNGFLNLTARRLPFVVIPSLVSLALVATLFGLLFLDTYSASAREKNG